MSVTALFTNKYDFSASPTSGVAPVEVNFTDHSQLANSWLWNFGDGTTSTMQNPSHVYTSAGTYSVTLQATNSVSGGNTITKSNLITVSVFPTISLTPTSANLGTVPVGTDTSSANQTFLVKNTGSGGLIIGAIGLTGNNPGDYTKVFDNCTGKTLAANLSCTIKVAFSPTTPGEKIANLTISSSDSNTPIFNVSLNGVGTSSVLLSVRNIGTGIGRVSSTPAGISCGTTCSAVLTKDIPVLLTAIPNTESSFAGWSGGGCSGNGTCTVALGANTAVAASFNALLPIAAFKAKPTTTAGPFAVNFTDQSQYVTSWQWDFGDGTTSIEQGPTHIYPTRGTYTVTLTATNSTESNTVSKKVIDFIDITSIIMLLLGD